MQIHNKIATDLSSILGKKFDKLTIANEQAQSTIEPESGRIFTLEYTGSGKSYGSVTVNIVDPDTLVVYYNNNITEEMKYNDKKDWYSFLKELRYFSKRNLMSFDVRNIGKQQLDKQDYAYIKTNDINFNPDDLSEGKLHGSIKTSYQGIGEARLIIKHSKPVDEEKHGARTRQIHSMYIENSNKERTRIPFKFLSGARALTQHVNQGGAVADDFGQHIHELIQEVMDLKKFVKAFRRADNFANEDAYKIIEQARERATGLVATLKTLSGPKGYRSYVEQYEPTESTVEQADLDDIRNKLVRIESNNIVDSVLPNLARGIKAMENNVTEVDQAEKDENDKFDAEMDAKNAAQVSDLIAFARSPEEIEVLDFPEHREELKARLNVIKSSEYGDTQQKNRALIGAIMDYLERDTVDDTLGGAMTKIDYNNKEQHTAAMLIAKKYLTGKVKITKPAEKKHLKKSEGLQLEDWANNLIEGTWTIPNTEEQVAELEKLMQQELPVGVDSENASGAMYNIIGDDELFDMIGELGDEDPTADSRIIIQRWVLANIERYDIEQDFIDRIIKAVKYNTVGETAVPSIPAINPPAVKSKIVPEAKSPSEVINPTKDSSPADLKAAIKYAQYMKAKMDKPVAKKRYDDEIAQLRGWMNAKSVMKETDDIAEVTMDGKIVFMGKEIDTGTIEYDMQDYSDMIFDLQSEPRFTDGTLVPQEAYDDLMQNYEFIDWVNQDYLDSMPTEGYKVLPSMPDKYVARNGLEGPIMTGSGKVVYYDNAEGKYYDPDTDMYMSYEEWKALDPELPIKEESMLQCKDCGDMLGRPTTDCEHDCNDPGGDHWIPVDLDGDGDADLAVKNEEIDYQNEIDRILGLAGLK